MRKYPLLYMCILIFVSSCLSACTNRVVNETELPTVTQTPSYTKTPFPTHPRNSLPTETATSTHSPTPIVEVLNENELGLLNGLVYALDDSIWTIDANGDSRKLYDCFASTRVSPDLRYALFIQDWDLWLMDHQTCTSRNLTDTNGEEEQFESGAMWWPGRSNTVLMGLYGAPYAFGSPSALNTQSGEMSVLSEEISSGPSFSPDGRKFAFDGYLETPFIYDLYLGKSELEIPTDQFSGEITKIASPAWSHDGTRIAWVAGIEDKEASPSWQIALLIFDLITEDVQILYRYIPLGVTGWPLAAVWSPEDEWLAFNVLAEDSEESGIWVVPSDGGPSHKLPTVSTGRMFWVPTSDYLLITNYVREPDTEPGVFSTEVWLVRTESWDVQRVDQLMGATIIDWK